MGMVAIFKGAYAKILASAGILFKAGAKIINGTDDPSSVATDAPAGSLYISTNGNVYRKTDGGSSINWVIVASNVAQVVRVGGAGADYATIADMHAAITDNGPLKQYVALLSPTTFIENVVLKPFIALVGVGNGSSTPLIVGKITATGFPAGFVTTLNRVGQSYTVASDGEVCNDWASPVLANDCFFDFNTANDYGFTGIRQSCADSPVNQVVSVLSFISCTSTYDGSTKDIVAYEATGNGAGNGLNQVEIRINAKASSGELILRKVSTTGTAPLTFQGCLLKVNNVKALSTATSCVNKTTGISTGARNAAGDQIQVNGNLASCHVYCLSVASDFQATGASVFVDNAIPVANICDTVVGGTHKIWLASTNRLMTKSGNGLAIVTPLDLVDTGFNEWSTVGADYWTYVAATRTFTVAKRGSGLIKSAPVVWAAGQSVVLTDFATNYVYVDSAGILQVGTTVSEAILENNIMLFEPWCQNLNIIVAKENHPVKFPAAVSRAWHNLLGALLQSGDSNLSINGVATNRELNFNGPNVLTDHGIDSAIPATTPVTWKVVGRRASDGKMYLYGSLTQLLSKIDTSATLTTVAAGAFVVGRAYEIKTPGSTNFTLIGAENNTVGTCFVATGVGAGTGDAYQLTTIPNAWVVLKLGVVKDSIQSSAPTFVAVLHSASFANEAAARNAIAADSIMDFPEEAYALEIVRVGYAIINGNASGTGTMATPVTDLELFRSQSGGGGASTSGSLITLNPTNFAERFSGTESNVQAMADRLDDYSHIPDWVATVSTYRVRDKVVYYGGIYRCVTAHTAGATFGADIAKWEQIAIARFADVTAAQAAYGNDNELCYVVSTNTFYRNEASGAGFTADSFMVLTTGAGGNTRWVGVAGQYNYFRKRVESLAPIATGDAIDFTDKYGQEYWYRVTGNAAGQNVMAALAFGPLPPKESFTVYIVGDSNVNTVVINTNDAQYGVLVAGGTVEIGRGTFISFKYSFNMERWIEVSRSNGSF